MNRLKGTGSRAESETEVLSPKEFARLLRRRAYEKEKERRAKDPKFIAMKEAAKARRREAYRQVKEERKAARADQKSKEQAKRSEERAQADAELMKMLTWATKGSNADN